jgi:hypothetical protein
MNTIDATPEHSFGGRATLSAESYERVNGTPRTNTQRRNKFTSCSYGKQILNGACSAGVPHSAYRICAKMSAPGKLVNGLARADARKAKLASARHSLVTVSNAISVKGLRRQRAAPNSSAMRRKSGAGCVEVGKGVTGHRDQRNRRRAFVEYPVGPLEGVSDCVHNYRLKAEKYWQQHPASHATADAKSFEPAFGARASATGIASAQPAETDPVARTTCSK